MTRASAPILQSRRRLVVAAVAVGVVAAAARFLLLRSAGGLSGLGLYDDGVYFSAAESLVHGRLPYRDFLLLHPPGLLLVLAPFAWLASVVGDAAAFIGARLFFIAIGGVNAALVVLVLRRYGTTAMLVGGVFSALFIRLMQAEQTIALETFGSAFLLGALLLLGRPAAAGRWDRAVPWIAGALLGLSVGQKIWFVVPAVVVIAFAWRRILPVLGGAVAAGCAVYLPFFAAAPAAMWREVVLDQLGRPASALSRLPFQLATIFGAPMRTQGGTPPTTIGTTLAFLLALVVAVAAVIAASQRGARLYVALLVATCLTLLRSPSLFWHYASLTAVPEALVLGVAVGALAARIRFRGVGVLSIVATAAMLTALTALDARVSTDDLGAGRRVDLGALRQAAARVDGCIVADDPTGLILANRVTPQLRAGCPLWPDTTGWTYDADRYRSGGKDVARIRNPLWQQRATRYLTSGAAVLLSRPDGTRLDAASTLAVTSGPRLFDQGGVVLYRTP